MSSPINNLNSDVFSLITAKLPPKNARKKIGSHYLDPSFCKPAQTAILNRAHQLWEQARTLYDLSLVCKSFNSLADKKLKELKTKIADTIHPILQQEGGAKCFRECVDSGAYLSILKIYYSIYPQSLKNLAHDPEKNEGNQCNILHNAIAPHFNGGCYADEGCSGDELCSQDSYSSSFTKFILELNKKEQLHLLDDFDASGKLPIHRVVSLETLLDLKQAGVLRNYVNALSAGGREPGQKKVPLLYFVFDSFCIDFIPILVEEGANVRWQDDDGNTILHLWLEKGDLGRITSAAEELCKYLSSSDLALTNKHGKTVLDIAIDSYSETFSGKDKFNYTKLIEILIKAGAPVTAQIREKIKAFSPETAALIDQLVGHASVTSLQSPAIPIERKEKEESAPLSKKLKFAWRVFKFPFSLIGKGLKLLLKGIFKILKSLIKALIRS